MEAAHYYGGSGFDFSFLYLALLENYLILSGLKTLSGSIFSAPDCFSF